ncbi:MAG TPA: zinc-binding dehydrogenase, partial [Usitatibacter sp.]|nr:zinc-binding dehydrogenase [Usitatibacter sp.]
NKLRTPEQRAAGVPAFVRDFLPAIRDGRIRPLIDSVHPLEQVAHARALMESNRHLGKIVISMGDA